MTLRRWVIGTRSTSPSDPVLAPVAKRLELAYYHAIRSEDFAKATRAKIHDNVSADQAETLRARIDRLAAMSKSKQTIHAAVEVVEFAITNSARSVPGTTSPPG